MQQPDFQEINREAGVKKYGKTFAGNLSKPLSLPSWKMLWSQDKSLVIARSLRLGTFNR